MTKDEKLKKIEAFAQGATAFEFTAELSPEVLRYRPFPEAWTVHEHVVHFLESDIATFNRYRTALARSGGPVLGYDEEAFTAKIDYHAHDLAETLELIKLLRRYIVRHLKTIVDLDWTQLAYHHNNEGRVDLEKWIETYIDHIRFHKELVDRNLRLWNEKKA